VESKKVLRSGLLGGREGKIGNLPPYLFIREGEKTERDVTSVTWACERCTILKYKFVIEAH